MAKSWLLISHIYFVSSGKQMLQIFFKRILTYICMVRDTYYSVHCCSSVFPVCLKSCISSCLFKAPLLNTQSALMGRLTHTWASTSNNKRAALLNSFLHAISATRHRLCKYAKWCCHKEAKLNAGLLVRYYRSCVFCTFSICQFVIAKQARHFRERTKQ